MVAGRAEVCLNLVLSPVLPCVRPCLGHGPEQWAGRPRDGRLGRSARWREGRGGTPATPGEVGGMQVEWWLGLSKNLVYFGWR